MAMWRKKLIASWIALAAAAAVADAATLTATLRTPDGKPLATNVVIVPVSTPYGAQGRVVTTVPVATNLAPDGTLSIQLAGGVYYLQLGRPPFDRIYFALPDDTNTYSLATLVTNAVSWTNGWIASTEWTRWWLQATNDADARDRLGVAGAAPQVVKVDGQEIGPAATINYLTGSNVALRATNVGGSVVNLQINAGASGGGGTSYQFNTNQFAVDGSAISLKTNALFTNVVVRSISSDARPLEIIGGSQVLSAESLSGQQLSVTDDGVWTRYLIVDQNAEVAGDLGVVGTLIGQYVMASYFAVPAFGAGVQGYALVSTNASGAAWWRPVAQTNAPYVLYGTNASWLSNALILVGDNVTIKLLTNSPYLVVTNIAGGGTSTNVLLVRTNSANVGYASILDFVAGTNVLLLGTNTDGTVSVQINAGGSGGSTYQFNTNQFALDGSAISLKTNALLTNVVVRSISSDARPLEIIGGSQVLSAESQSGQELSVTDDGVWTRYLIVNESASVAGNLDVDGTLIAPYVTAGQLSVPCWDSDVQGYVLVSTNSIGAAWWRPVAQTNAPYVLYGTNASWLSNALILVGDNVTIKLLTNSPYLVVTNIAGGGTSTNVLLVRTNSANVGYASILDFVSGTNVVLSATNSGGTVSLQINAGGSGGGSASYRFDSNQFAVVDATNVSIKAGANVTNLTAYGSQVQHALTIDSDGHSLSVMAGGDQHLLVDSNGTYVYRLQADTAAATALTVGGTFKLTPGAAAGYVLTSDGSGTGSWQPAPGGYGLHRMQTVIEAWDDFLGAGSSTFGISPFRWTSATASGGSILGNESAGRVGVLALSIATNAGSRACIGSAGPLAPQWSNMAVTNLWIVRLSDANGVGGNWYRAELGLANSAIAPTRGLLFSTSSNAPTWRFVARSNQATNEYDTGVLATNQWVALYISCTHTPSSTNVTASIFGAWTNTFGTSSLSSSFPATESWMPSCLLTNEFFTSSGTRYLYIDACYLSVRPNTPRW